MPFELKQNPLKFWTLYKKKLHTPLHKLHAPSMQ